MDEALGSPAHVARSTAGVPPSDDFKARARIQSRAEWDALYQRSIEDPEGFWLEQARRLPWSRPPTVALQGDDGSNARWFADGMLNVSVACLDRWKGTSTWQKAALVWEGEPLLGSGEPEVVTVTYAQLHARVQKLAAKLRRFGVVQGDRVAIYMGMVPEVVVAMLACARIGAIHTVVFGGFSADALRDRIRDCTAKVLITQDVAYRRGQRIELFAAAKEAVAQCPSVEAVLVHPRLPEHQVIDDEAFLRLFALEERGQTVLRFASRDDLIPGVEAAAPAIVPAEHPLFILYTSGSTGKPKGVLHTSAGYLLGVHLSSRYVFDLRDDDLFFCTADVGWVTGHSYVVYGPLSCGATCLVYEGAPNYPRPDRWWDIIERHRVTILYTAPTAIRAFVRTGEEWPARHDLSSLRLLGTVGEPINPEVWSWYHRVIGRKNCPIVDTWWQTETGAIAITTLPGAHEARPGSAGVPFFGVVPEIVDAAGAKVPRGTFGRLLLRRPTPSMLRTLWGDDERYRRQYWNDVPNAYTTGDGAKCDADGYHWIVGRIDDVLNVAGHRIGTAEIESAVVSHPAVAEAAAVGRPDELKGQALVVFVTLKSHIPPSDDLRARLLEHVAKEIGKFARPDALRFAAALPKTRSGKIMRRLLRDLAAGVTSRGDTSTLEDFSVLAQLSTEHHE